MKKYIFLILFLLVTFVSATELNGTISNNMGTDETSGSLTGNFSNLIGTIKYINNHSCSASSECYSNICCSGICSSSCSDSGSNSNSGGGGGSNHHSNSNNNGNSVDLNTVSGQNTNSVDSISLNTNAKSEFPIRKVVIPVVLVGLLSLLVILFIKIIK